jgi:hypothetical protein
LLTGVCTTDEAGSFNFLPQDFTGRRELILETTKKRTLGGKTKQQALWTYIPLNRVFGPPASPYSLFDTTIPEWDASVLDSLNSTSAASKKSLSEMQLLKEVTIRSKKVVRVEKDNFFDVEKDINDWTDRREWYPSSIAGYMQIKDPRCQLTNGNSRTRYESGVWWPYNAYFYERDHKVDAKREHGVNFIEQPIETVQKILATKDPLLLSEVSQSIIPIPNDPNPLPSVKMIALIYLYNNWTQRQQIGARYTYLDGFSAPAPIFYQPDYSRNVLPGDVDYRRTLYWNPTVTTDASGKANVAFYNNSTCKALTVSAETLTTKGLTLTGKFNVK